MKTVRNLLLGVACLGLLVLGWDALPFYATADSLSQAEPPVRETNLAKATFAGGCFWCMEKPFDQLEGVVSTTSGYTGGVTVDPTYDQVSRGGTGHVEAVEVLYDPTQVSYDRLLEVFCRNVDPVDDTGQFCDKGSQYHAKIFTHDEQQQQLADRSKQALATLPQFRQTPIATAIESAQTFYPAEAYHQDYYLKHPVRYKFYRTGCGRDARLQALWGR